MDELCVDERLKLSWTARPIRLGVSVVLHRLVDP